MLTAIEQLLTLQDRDQRIGNLQQALQRAPTERAELEQQLAASAAGVEALKQRQKETEVQRKKLENDAQAKRDAISRFKNQQFQTRKNEEFQALTNEIKRAEKEISDIEDGELELMETADKLRAEIAAAQKEAAEAQKHIQGRLADIEANVRAIDQQLQELRQDREERAKQIDEDLFDRYERLFASKGDAAVVPLEHEVCMGCHMKITTQTSVRVKGNKEIVGCDQCGRILYSPE